VQLEHARADADRAAHERDQAKVQLEKQRIELQRARQEASAPSDAVAAPPASPVIAAPPIVYYSGAYSSASYDPGLRRATEATRSRASPSCADERCRRTSSAPDDPRNRPFPIPGVRNPFDYLR
jgi:hypothetical protein